MTKTLNIHCFLRFQISRRGDSTELWFTSSL